MSTLTSTHFDAIPSARPSRPSVFRRAVNAIIEARQRSAQRQVNAYLLELDDATLESYGYNRADLLKNAAACRSY